MCLNVLLPFFNYYLLLLDFFFLISPTLKSGKAVENYAVIICFFINIENRQNVQYVCSLQAYNQPVPNDATNFC